MMDSADILVVSPHPDDAEYGVAGTVVRWVREGKKVVYVLCTSGEKGSSDPATRPEELVATREREQRAAATVLGVSDVVFLRYADQGLEDTPDFRKDIVRQIRRYRPDTVVTADPYRRYFWHRDHRVAGQVVLDAVFPYARDRLAYPDLLQEGLEPHKVKEVLLWASEKPNYHSDITGTFDIKVAALCCHRSQVGDTLSPEMQEWLLSRARNAAEGQPYELAESFYRAELRWR